MIHEFVGLPGERYGASVAAAGDLDADGHDDILVTAPFASVGAFQTGRIDALSGADGSLLWSVAGFNGGDRLGGGSGGVGDINGDGVPDVTVAASFAGPSAGGEAWALSGTDGAVIHHLLPHSPGTAEVFGLFFCSGAGDVDGDGIGDIYIGDYGGRFRGGPGSGQGYVFSGADGAEIHRFDAEFHTDGVGPGRGIGDVNADGYGDVIVAAYTSSSGAPGAGKALVRSGVDGSVIREITGSVPNDSLGVDALAVGDVNGDGLVDYLITAVGLDFAGVDVGRAYIVAGTP